MATARRPYGLDDRGKKDDNPSRRRGSSSLASMLYTIVSLRRRRVLLALLAVCVLYLFFKNIPTDLPPVSDRIDSRYGRLRPQSPFSKQYPPSSPPQGPFESTTQGYDGPIKFFKLGAALRRSKTPGTGNVLFAFSSPQSASRVLTAACAMANHNRTQVHVALMGRKEMAMADILALNGIPEVDCPVHWHEAQPDFALQSTEERMQTAVEAALGHFHRALPLQAAFIDDRAREDDFLRNGVKSRIRSIGVPLLQVPRPDAWLLTLDPRSLRQYDQVQIEILVQAVRDSSGSLLRLLRSIHDADYSGLTFPKITLELPYQVDPFVLDYLTRFKWPPASSPADSKLTVRHRVEAKLMSPAMASGRFIESFYPPVPANSHVLVLSLDTELSSNYYQFLMYMLLEYKYSIKLNLVSSMLMGISLAGPSEAGKGSKITQSPNSNDSPVLLWRRPSASAALYFGEQWAELHAFLTHRLSSDPELALSMNSEPTSPSEWPAWVKIASEWMQIRGTFMAYPTTEITDSPLVTMHSELHQPPEEHSRETLKQKTSIDEVLKLGNEGDILTAEETRAQSDWERPMLSTASLTTVLGRIAHKKGSFVPEASDLEIYDFGGDALSWQEAKEKASKYAERFSEVIGKCSSRRKEGSVETDGLAYLFCREASGDGS